MKSNNKLIQGDLALWGFLALLAIFSFFPVFSASSNLSYVVGNGTPWQHLFKHMIILVMGFAVMIVIHRIPYHYFKGLSILMLPIVILLLIYTVSQGAVIGGANASRWIRIPFVGIGFQTSTLASLILMMYVARYLDKTMGQQLRFEQTLLPLWLPVGIVIALILPANLSTAVIVFTMVFLLCFFGGYPFKHLLVILGIGLVAFTLFVLAAKAFPDATPNRIDTWVSRIENFSSPVEGGSGNYQVERAKIAIATGGVTGLGVGKSVMKNFLPQSSSDFIYAIIVEEFGLVGGVVVISLYLIILFRLMLIARRANTVYGKLLVIGVGLPVIVQAFINIGVALNVFPVTGQTLPMISSGGTAALMTCFAFGVILSASVASVKQEEEQKEVNQDNPLAVLSETI
ncbi:MAG: FtsW/RodA/SpoVE family cell cycle protein [Flavobacteriaceae bacterium]|nr:FtsW/RodA/SpoVE family cell cycle protein [Flavobacteriaceae bacterium]